MPKINILDKHIAELIAAGEVVERPSSVVKELLENSIDAGATSITLEIKQGGITYIRITDNGCGISRGDVAKAFISHATSKILSHEDLNAITTLGFRGEALPSIAAVSRVEIITRTKDEFSGTRYVIEGGEEILIDDAGCPEGTTLIVRDIFYNTPARMKFLKKDVAEANSVAGVVDRIALSHPEVSIRFIRDGKEVLLTPGDSRLTSAIYAVLGKTFSEGLIPIEYTLNSISVSGFISKPLTARPNRSMQFFFINGRLVKTRTAMAALEQAYKNSIMIGKFPSCVMNIEIEPHTVDVNVHPAKLEVRFSNEKAIFDAVYYAVKNTIEKNDTRPQVDFSKLKKPVVTPPQPDVEQIKFEQKKSDFFQNKSSKEFRQEFVVRDNSKANYKLENSYKTSTVVSSYNNTSNVKNSDIDIIFDEDFKPEIKPVKEKASQPIVESQEVLITEIPSAQTKEQEEMIKQVDFIVIGEAFKTYIIVQIEEKLLIIDKHAAHERIIYEQLKSRVQGSESQLMLTPVTVTLNKEEYSAVLENVEVLNQAGFVVEDFGAGTVIVRECPLTFDSQEIMEIIMELAGYLLKNTKELIPEKLDWIYHSSACRAAIKAGDKTSSYELEQFVKLLLSRDDIRYCPHGRPVIVEMTKYELEKLFGRV